MNKSIILLILMGILKGLIGTATILFGFWLILSVPDFLEWLSIYIGEFFAYGLFFLTLGGAMYYWAFKR